MLHIIFKVIKVGIHAIFLIIYDYIYHDNSINLYMQLKNDFFYTLFGNDINKIRGHQSRNLSRDILYINVLFHIRCQHLLFRLQNLMYLFEYSYNLIFRKNEHYT